jgi:hypothetical protein
MLGRTIFENTRFKGLQVITQVLYKWWVQIIERETFHGLPWCVDVFGED